MACSHQWINPKDPRIARMPYSPIIGPERYQMKCGITYHCRNCGAVCTSVELETPRLAFLVRGASQ